MAGLQIDGCVYQHCRRDRKMHFAKHKHNLRSKSVLALTLEEHILLTSPKPLKHLSSAVDRALFAVVTSACCWGRSVCSETCGAWPRRRVCVEVVPTTDVATAFKDIDVAVLVGAMPRREGMERKDLLKANVTIFKKQGQAMDQFAKKTVKVTIERWKRVAAFLASNPSAFASRQWNV